MPSLHICNKCAQVLRDARVAQLDRARPSKVEATRANRVGCAISVQNRERREPPIFRLRRRPGSQQF